jgi:Dolichyl-phosphate-mannose-protein mannosyltransferase
MKNVELRKKPRQSVFEKREHSARRFSILNAQFSILLLLLLALGLRLLVWQWHRLYDLGGDEREYFEQALTLLREHRYVELKLMRPPLYTGFLAVCIYLFDSLVQRLRLIQELLSALTVVPTYALTRRLFDDRRVAFVAGLLMAANYTLAANATELLTETLFLLGLTTLFWLLLKAGGPRTDDPRPTTDDRQGTHHVSRFMLYAALAGLTLGALTLLRSVALPLLPLGALWLLVRRPTTDDRRPTTDDRPGDQETRDITHHASRITLLCSLFFVLCSLLVVAPWTIRNYITYGAPILVDTTGPENLWLDNDPAGREAVKRQLYDLGDDRAARQRLALTRGAAAIADDPARFLTKAWGEAQKFFALQYFDDLRERREIWVPPAEVWMRLLLGDGLWLVILLGGAVGLWLAPTTDHRPPTADHRPPRRSMLNFHDPRWLFVSWALYTLLTALVFHVELRYRLPLYPALLPYAAWTIVRILDLRQGQSKIKNQKSKMALASLSCALLVSMMLLHRSYLSESWMLGWKHAQLWQAERALTRGDAVGAQISAQAALDWDGDSALARVALARAVLLEDEQRLAIGWLDAAVVALRAHPHAHLLRGAILRAQGDGRGAREELSFERSSLEDLQGWAWRTFMPVAPAPAAVEVGGGLDLGFVRGFWLPEKDAFRWSGAESEIMLLAPPGATRLELRLAAGRPPGAPPATLVVSADGRELGRIRLQSGWRTYSLPLAHPAGPLVVMLSSDTFRPRDYDRASADDRALGVMVSQIAIRTQ